MSDDPTDPHFWNVRFQKGKTPWDLGKIPEGLEDFLTVNPEKGKVLIPGCGTGYEVRAFHEAGYDVVAIDFSTEAVKKARKQLGGLADRIILGDFFRHPFPPASFEWVYERTFLCSFPPEHWRDYCERIRCLLKPGGQLIGTFFYGFDDEPPPYGLTEASANDLFKNHFDLTEEAETNDSLPLYAGREKWQRWTRRP